MLTLITEYPRVSSVVKLICVHTSVDRSTYLTSRKETMENDNINAINSHNFVNYALIVVHKTTHTRCSIKIKEKSKKK